MNTLSTADAAQQIQVSVLKKATQLPAQAVQQLVQSLPQPNGAPSAAPALATNGALGTRLNTYA